MTILIDLSVAGINTGPFNLYSDADGYTSAFATNITRQQLLDGYPAVVLNGTTNIKLQSLSDICPNDTILPVSTTTSTTSTSTSTTTTTSTSTSTSTTTTTTTVACYTVGQAALGGIIAYILEPGDPDYVEGEQNGIVVTTTDVSTSALWGCEPTEILGADGTALGTGKQNTISIMAGCPTAGIAARLCGNLIEGGYSDWFLPSKDELNKVWLNRVAIGGLSIFEYWTSSEYSNFQAWFQSFASGGTMNFASKSNLFRVRAVRTF